MKNNHLELVLHLIHGFSLTVIATIFFTNFLYVKYQESNGDF